jgi:3'(2'), 5'-bisphosphate nucleotidase
MLNFPQLQQLCRIAQMAGDEIMAVYGQDVAVHEKPDQSPLTEADLRADRVIAEGLQAHFSQWPVVSEESGLCLGSDVAVNTFFLVDPLDGTKEFIQRNGEFTVNMALIDSGRPVAGVVFAPALNELYFGVVGLGVFKQDASGTRPISTRALQPEQTIRVMGSRSHGAERLQQWLAALKRPYSFVAAGSSLKFCRVAEGAADVYPRLGPTSQWDTAAAQAILELAGGCVVSLEWQALTYGTERPVLNPEFMAWGDASAIGGPLALGT